MANQSPQRSRKATQPQQQQQQQQQQQDRQQTSTVSTGPPTSATMGASSSGGVQPNGRRETSPSPSLRERQRYARTQSMPLVAPLSQQTASQQGQKTQSHQRHQSSPSQDSFKSAPTYKDIGVQDDDSELPHLLSSTHPPLLQSHSYTLPQTSQQQQQQGRYPQPQPTRVHPPQFITRLQDESKVWHMTTELFNDIERADLQQQAIQQRQSPPAPGTEGVAYAGGAGGSSYRYVNSQKQANEKTRNQEGGSGGSNGSAGRNQAQNRERGRDVARDASQNTLARNARGGSRPLTPEARPGSPAYYAQAQTQAPTPPVATRRGTTGSPPTAAAPTTVYNNSNNSNNNANNNAPSPRPLKNRTPDRSLPVQEEPDDHENGHSVTAGIGLQRRASPVPSSDLSASNDLRTSPRQGKDQEATLIDLGPDTDDAHHTDRQSQQIVKKLSDEDDAELSYTPRSPSAALPEPGSLLPDGSRGIHEVLDSKGTTVNDQNAFNATAFEQTMKKLQADMGEHAGHRQNQPPLSSRNDSRTSWYTSWLPDYYHQAYADDREFMDDMAYFTQYIQTPISTNSRPGAPVPPTPHSQSGTRSPMPHQPLQPMPRSLIPPFSPAPPSGTPYPYPFSHLRRNYAYPARVSRLATPATAGAGPTYEPTLEEQLEYHMRIYAMNNGGAVTDSTLSPSSTPYPGMGQNYHPFSAFLAQARNRAAFLGGNGGDEHISVSRRSSPSHEPVAFPPPNFRGRGLKKRSRFALRNGNGNGTNGRTRINPPPRVESTQPKDTSPEPSSGEETAGGDYVAQIQQNGEWVNDDNSPNGVRQHEDEGEDEWIDEDSGDEDSFLGLEYHPTYINNMLRRRKRWEQKWKDLVTAFRALDQQTDTTMVLLAAPSHNDSLYSVTSRSIRRDPSLRDHPTMPSIRDGFAQIASQRRVARANQMPLLERLYAYTSGSDDGSPSTTGSSREDDLKRALHAAVTSLSAMKQMYDMREVRWTEEAKRNAEEREGVEMLLSQILGGTGHPPIPPPIQITAPSNGVA